MVAEMDLVEMGWDLVVEGGCKVSGQFLHMEGSGAWVVPAVVEMVEMVVPEVAAEVGWVGLGMVVREVGAEVGWVGLGMVVREVVEMDLVVVGLGLVVVEEDCRGFDPHPHRVEQVAGEGEEVKEVPEVGAMVGWVEMAEVAGLEMVVPEVGAGVGLEMVDWDSAAQEVAEKGVPVDLEEAEMAQQWNTEHLLRMPVHCHSM